MAHRFSLGKIISWLKYKYIVVTCSAGYVGSELRGQLWTMEKRPSKIIWFNNNESSINVFSKI